MLFRTQNGNLIELKKSNFINDKLYNQKILEIKKPTPKIENHFNPKTLTK
jgi:hypothetical protein